MAYETLEVQSEGEHILIVSFNRPTRKNAFSQQQYLDVVSVLNQAAQDSTRVVVLTGKGDFYSSGNDLATFMKYDLSDDAVRDKVLKESKELLHSFIAAFINFPKILIAMVNGPAIGVAATTLQLCDFVYASDKAFLNTPFVPTAQCPEAASSYTFPLAMGHLKANEVLLLGKKVSAEEAVRSNLFNAAFPAAALRAEVMAVAKQLANSPIESLLVSKSLIRNKEFKEKLLATSNREVDALTERWTSPEFFEAITAFMTRRSKM